MEEDDFVYEILFKLSKENGDRSAYFSVPLIHYRTISSQGMIEEKGGKEKLTRASLDRLVVNERAEKMVTVSGITNIKKVDFYRVKNSEELGKSL